MDRLLHGLALIVYVLLVTKSTVSDDVKCIESERLALLELKHGFVDVYDRLSTWGDGEHQKECCNWTGIHCSPRTNHVVLLDLRGPIDKWKSRLQPLQGIFPAASLSKFDSLTYLDLSCNDFTDTEIPKSIGSLIHLRYLNLSLSSFGGTIPPQLGNLSNLQYLDFRLNYLVGVIPNSLVNLSNLEYLDLSWNYPNLKSNLEWLPNLTSLRRLSLSEVDIGTAHTWPKLLTNLTHLETLDLSDCNLVGNIPEQLGALSQLQYLDLSDNSLTGIIPHQLGNLSQLQYLDLSDNYLTGIIPHQLGNLSQLKDLTLGFNKLHGYIPNQLEHLSCLQRLNLQQNQLSGTIPNSLLDLCHLRFLDLSLNNFSGHLEDFLIGTMGRTSRRSHQFLQTLDLSSNELTGSIPDLSFLMELQVLDLSCNELNGTLSDGIGQLSNLVRLVIGSNPLQGTITEHHFSQLSRLVDLVMSNTSLSFNISKSWVPPFQLETLYLDDCKIGPYFPEWLKNQRSIILLSLRHNEIVDVPNWFWRGFSSNLVLLDLSNNKIQGEIANLPVQLSHFPIIDLSANQMRGEIPPFLFQAGLLNLSTNIFSGSILPSLCSMTSDSSLNILDISRNQFSEDLTADCWLHFKQLLYLDFSFNNFSGEVPASLLSLPNLQFLHLGNNKFRSIPSSLSSNISSLRSLDLSENGISGFLPSWIGDKVCNLNVLSLRNNFFYGSMPFNICNLTRLIVLDLSANHLSGFIPKCFNQFIGLSNSSNIAMNGTFHFATSNDSVNSFEDSMAITWKGGVVEYKGILGLQRMIDLSNNQLTGEIPDEIMDLVQLFSLNLSDNKLGGEINQKIGQLQNLESLDLSRNLLHGPIPPSISQLYSLSSLNLSFNNLSGKIPTGYQLQTLNDPTIYFGNPELCGTQIDRICPDDRKSNITGEREDEKDNLFEMYGFYIFMAFGFIVGFWTSCGSLIFWKSWRYICFNFCSRMCDHLYVKVGISINKLRRRLEA